jgi:hypothetical protein
MARRAIFLICRYLYHGGAPLRSFFIFLFLLHCNLKATTQSCHGFHIINHRIDLLGEAFICDICCRLVSLAAMVFVPPSGKGSGTYLGAMDQLLDVQYCFTEETMS